MPHAHNVDARDATTNIPMHAFEVPQNSFLPVIPIVMQQELAVLGSRPLRERPIEGPNCAVNVRAQTLVGRIHVAKSRGLHEYTVPGRIAAVSRWKAFQGK